jgi:hypothetical protein
MRRFVLVLLLLAAALPGRAQVPATDLGAADRAAIRAAIEGQMAAFRRDDGPGAFAFASPGIQTLFGTPDNFMAMVRAGYQPVYRPRGVAFRDPVRLGDQLVQPVEVIGPDGAAVLALYPMERQPDGSWRIAGCQLVDLPDQRA